MDPYLDSPSNKKVQETGTMKGEFPTLLKSLHADDPFERDVKKWENGKQLASTYTPDEYVYKSGEGLNATYGTDVDVSYVE